MATNEYDNFSTRIKKVEEKKKSSMSSLMNDMLEEIVEVFKKYEIKMICVDPDDDLNFMYDLGGSDGEHIFEQRIVKKIVFDDKYREYLDIIASEESSYDFNSLKFYDALDVYKYIKNITVEKLIKNSLKTDDLESFEELEELYPEELKKIDLILYNVKKIGDTYEYQKAVLDKNETKYGELAKTNKIHPDIEEEYPHLSSQDQFGMFN